MVSLSHLITFFMILSFVLFLGYSSVPATGGIGQQANDTLTKYQAMGTALNSTLVVVSNAPIIGTISFPNVFAIFYSVFVTLFSMVSLPTALVNGIGLPPILALGIGSILLVLSAIKIVGWFKGDSS